MNKFYILAATALISAAPVYADGLIPGAPTDFNVAFDFNGGTPVVSGSLYAPTLSYSWSDPQPISEIGRIEILRGCYDVGEYDLPVYTFNNPEPGAFLTFVDEEEMEYGYSYSYSARCYAADGTSGGSEYKYIFIGIKPGKVSLEASTADNGQLPVTFTVTAPLLTDSGEELPAPLTKLEVCDYISYDNEVTLKTIENPTPGETYTFDLDVTPNIKYCFTAYAHTDFGKSDRTSVYLYVGTDVPAAPTGLTMEVTDNGVELAWEAPAAGHDGGWIDPAETRYTVSRVIGYDEYVIAENVEGCAYTDTCEDLTCPTQMYYRVTATNGIGKGDYVTSDLVTVGPDAALPFFEHFNNGNSYNKGPVNLWEKDPQGYYSEWYYGYYDYSLGMTGAGILPDPDVDTNEGYAYASLTWWVSAGDRHSLTSVPVSMKDAEHPVLSFYTASNPGNSNRFSIGVVADGESKELTNFRPGDLQTIDEEQGLGVEWKKQSIVLDEYAGKTVKFFFTAIVDEDKDKWDNVYLDEILVDDYRSPAGLTATPDGDMQTRIHWDACENSTGEASHYLVSIDGAEPVVANGCETFIATKVGETHTAAVKAVYGDIESNYTRTLTFQAGVETSVEVTTVSGASVYFDLTGRAVANPAKGSVVIRRSTAADGTVTVEKVMF